MYSIHKEFAKDGKSGSLTMVELNQRKSSAMSLLLSAHRYSASHEREGVEHRSARIEEFAANWLNRLY
jgi:hypothetical protein